MTGVAAPPMEGRLVRSDGNSVDVIMSATPLFDEQGSPRGAIASIVDISERKKAEAAQSRLLHELQHRVKNILVTVAALADRMLASGASLSEFATAFHGRLMAMGKLQELLSKAKWQSVDLGTLARTVLEPHVNSNNDNILLDGLDVILPPNVATTLGMALHEMATNAAKYGALSVADGRVELSWRIIEQAGARQLSLDWKERNGPRIETFPVMGFGSRFIAQSIDYELEGVAKLTFEPDGFRASIEFPLREPSLEG